LVQAGDTLALIARHPEIYGDASMWMLLYRANAGQLRSADWLCPGQLLAVPRGFSDEDAQVAREEARRRAPWPPGAKPAAASMCGPTPEALKAKAEAASRVRATAGAVQVGGSSQAPAPPAARARASSGKPGVDGAARAKAGSPETSAAGAATSAPDSGKAAESTTTVAEATKSRQPAAGKSDTGAGKAGTSAGQSAGAVADVAARAQPRAKTGTGPAQAAPAADAATSAAAPAGATPEAAALPPAETSASAASSQAGQAATPSVAPATANPVTIGASRNAYREAARRAYAVGDISWATYYYREHLAKNPRDPDALGELGNIYYRSGDLSAAAGLYYDAACILIERGNALRASQLLLPVSEGNPALADDLYLRLMAAAPRGR
jgi:hypothetical protein